MKAHFTVGLFHFKNTLLRRTLNMECKPKFEKREDGQWICKSFGTDEGVGDTPEKAYLNWMSKFSYKIDLPDIS